MAAERTVCRPFINDLTILGVVDEFRTPPSLLLVVHEIDWSSLKLPMCNDHYCSFEIHYHLITLENAWFQAEKLLVDIEATSICKLFSPYIA